jgi:hypothetical protein
VRQPELLADRSFEKAEQHQIVKVEDPTEEREQEQLEWHARERGLAISRGRLARGAGSSATGLHGGRD